MLETPKSAKTPSTPGIPNSCTTSAILENDDSTSFTVVPNFFSRSAASASACASRSRLINFPDVNLDAMAAEWPPAPSVASMYVPSGLTSSHSSTSSSITGVCGSAPLPTAPHSALLDTNSASFNRRCKHTLSVALDKPHRACPDLNLFTWPRPFALNQPFELHTQRRNLVIRKWFILQLIDHPGVIHDFQVVQLPEDIHLGLQLRRFPEHPGKQQPALPVHFDLLPEIAGPQ